MGAARFRRLSVPLVGPAIRMASPVFMEHWAFPRQITPPDRDMRRPVGPMPTATSGYLVDRDRTPPATQVSLMICGCSPRPLTNGHGWAETAHSLAQVPVQLASSRANTVCLASPLLRISPEAGTALSVGRAVMERCGYSEEPATSRQGHPAL